MQMEKKQKLLKSVFTFSLFCTFSMLFFGCGEKDATKNKTEKVGGKQLLMKDSLSANEAEVVLINASGSEASQVFPVEDEIHLDEWMQLVKDIKSTLGEMEEESKQVLQTSKPR